MNKKIIVSLIIILIIGIISYLFINTNNKKENIITNKTTLKTNTTQNITNKVSDLISLTPTNTFAANNLKITLENNNIYLILNDIKYDLRISNVDRMFTNRQKMSSFYNIYILTIDGKLYGGSLSTIREYKNEEIDTIKSYFSISKANKTVLNLYKTQDEKIVYEDINNTYYYLSNNSLY